MYTVYILYSDFLDRYYIGYTNQSINSRINKHLAKHSGFTGKTPDWILKYIEVYPDKKHAMQRERQIKSWKSRIMIEKLIHSTE